MACKRSATSELTQDNWNKEEIPEEAGTFRQASADDLKERVLITAKRRVKTSGKNAFSSFTGFKTPDNVNAKNQFSFLSNINSSNTTKAASTTNGSQNTSENGTNEVKIASTSTSSTTTTNTSIFSKDSAKSSSEKAMQKKSTTYYSKLKGLNEGVSQWIKKHVDADPYCILTPIFKDYEKYLKEIEALKPEANESQWETDDSQTKVNQSKSVDLPAKATETTSICAKVKTSLSSVDSWKPEKSIFSNKLSTTSLSTTSASNNANMIFGKTEQNKSENLFTSADSETNPFFKKNTPSTSSDASTAIGTVSTDNNVSTKADTKTASVFGVTAVNPATFSFGQSSVGTASARFSFGGGKPFTFGTQVAKSTQDSNEKAEEDENKDDEPPKPEFKPIIEEGSIYEKRCKVYVKKSDSTDISNRGVGTLFLKPTPNGKTQLIVRAVNSLGNLLLNTLLTPSTPIKRTKEKCIMLICLPMPDSEPPPTSVFLQVKTKEDADSLLEALETNAK